jgi:hypothetical protein
MAVLVAAKATVSFGMGFNVLKWVHRDGFLFIGLVFAGLMLLTCPFGVVLIVYEKGIRRWNGKWKALHGYKL